MLEWQFHRLHLATSGQNHSHLSSVKYILNYIIESLSTLFSYSYIMRLDLILVAALFLILGLLGLNGCLESRSWCPKIFLWSYKKALTQLIEDFSSRHKKTE